MSSTRIDQPALRWVAGILLVVATVIHFEVGLGFFSVLSVLFILSGLGTLLGAVLLWWRPLWGWVVGGGVAGLTAIGYVLRSTVGLPPLIPHAIPFAQPLDGAICTVVEIVVALLAVSVLAGSRQAVASRT
jgi:hypothetical protein